MVTLNQLATTCWIPMPTQLSSQIMNDGTRQFALLPQTTLWQELHDHVASLNGVVITNFMTDGITEAWIDFKYRGHSFNINDQFGDYWFFVDDPNCPDEILQKVVNHCERLLKK
ncbi:MAG: hypothetical protein HOP33_08600 [Verrucomicrobia bacterium]|nr:hypothetical protein [Verrucomicrobiota bacterium]